MDKTLKYIIKCKVLQMWCFGMHVIQHTDVSIHMLHID